VADAPGHAEHDPLLVASLLDGDLAPSERTEAEARVAGCPACASLYEDLLALSVATRTQPVPGRRRDFRLTPADAARLLAEPVASPPRLTDVMTEPSPAHRSHDTTLVASLSDHSLAPSERAAAEALVTACSTCAALHADLVALVAANRAMPTPPRPADYTLTPADAARLRGRRWRRLVAAIGSSRDGFTRPLAVGLTTLGLVGVLIASVPTVLQSPAGLGGSAASNQLTGTPQPVTGAAPRPVTDTAGEPEAGGALAPASGGDSAADATAEPARAPDGQAPIFGAAASPPAAAPSGPGAQVTGKGAEAGPTEPPTTDAVSDVDTPQAPASDVDPLRVISTMFLLAGVTLFILRSAGRRLTDD
jgi:anti-sigma factor RsiW